jgi:hypothetical protein
MYKNILTSANFRKALGFSRTVTGPPEGGHYVQMKIAADADALAGYGAAALCIMI